MSAHLPPFRKAASLGIPDCCPHEDERTEEIDAASASRLRLGDMSINFHCSVIGTCLTTGELRKIMSRFHDVDGLDDVTVHHEAVESASAASTVCKALNKALDRRHAATVRQFGQVGEPDALAALWKQALVRGEIPSAYWAILTHRHASDALRKLAFGDVHMLSHLVGAANRADIRRLVELQAENAALRERIARDAARHRAGIEDRDNAVEGLRRDVAALQSQLACPPQSPAPAVGPRLEPAPARADPVALQVQRRERAEQNLGAAQAEVARLQAELDHERSHAEALGQELSAAEAELARGARPAAPADDALAVVLRGARVLYVGGRPSTAPTIRDLVSRCAGEFQRHDGGLEDRKGLLAHQIAWATIVVFPVDCIDHDSATLLKRMCLNNGTPFVPLRSAGIASFAGGLLARAAAPGRPITPRRCS